MNDSHKKFKLLLSMAVQKRDASAYLLKEATNQLEKDQQQKRMLQRYQIDYQTDSANKYKHRENLSNFHNFMSKLQEAILQLAGRIEAQTSVVERCRVLWLESEIYVKQIEKLVVNRENKIVQKKEKQFQKENDAAGLNLFLYKKSSLG